MRLLITLGASDKFVSNHIYPLTLLNKVSKIFIVRDLPGPKLPKVEYCCPPPILSKFMPIRVLFKLILLIYLSLTKKPDIILSYYLYAYGINAFIAAKLTKKPVSISLIAGPIMVYHLGAPVNKIPYSRPLPKLSILGKLINNILKRCDAITVTGSFTKKFLINQGINEKKVFILPFAVSDKNFRPVFSSKKYDVIFIGRLAGVKHVEILLKAVSKVKSRYRDVKIGIVGDGPCKSYLEKLSNDLRIKDNVEFLGYKEDVACYLYASKMFVLPSEREGFPIAVIEAMMCGTPVIVSNCGDVLDVLKDGFNCIIIDDYLNVDGFANAIIRLLEDKTLCNTLSKNALAGINKAFSVENTSDAWRKIFTHLGIYSE